MYSSSYPHQGGAAQPSHAPLPAYPAPGLASHQMYNQYAPHQSPYAPGNPIMTSMPLHNGGMQHSVPHYQTPYTSSIPTSTAAGPGGHPQAYQASFAMNMQQPQQRMMQPPPPSSTPNSHSGGPSRSSPYAPPALPHQMTPPNISNPQFAPHPSQAHQQSLPGQQQQQNIHQSHQSIPQNVGGNQNHNGQTQQQTTPSTPTILPPLSPGSESREKKRVSLLLDINRDLLMEVMRLQALQMEIKKEAEGDASPESKVVERKNQATKDYMECMRRLQHNLAYLAAVADRNHKPSAQIPHHPVLMFAPPLSQSTTNFNFSSPMMTNATPTKLEHPNSPNNPPAVSKAEGDIHIEKESRIDSLKENYKRLQELFGLTEAECKKENQEMQAQRQQYQGQQVHSQNQPQQSPLSGGQRPQSQQATSNQLQSNMGMQMQGQGQQQQMNLAMNSAMNMASMQNSGMGGGGGMSMPSQVDMGFQRGGASMQR